MVRMKSCGTIYVSVFSVNLTISFKFEYLGRIDFKLERNLGYESVGVRWVLWIEKTRGKEILR
jgi:hypothetical protein